MTQAIPGYPPQAYPQQQFQQPAYPPAQYPPQQFAPGYPTASAAPPAAPLAQGSIEDFYNQPSAGGGKSISFQGKAPGYRVIGIVTRPIGQGDIQQQTDIQGRPQFFRDGRPKFVMKVPLQMQPSPEYPDGLGTWYVKGQARDELVRAMGEAGAPAGPPEAGSIIDVTFTGTRPSGPGMNPANIVAVNYTRPSGETSSPAPAVSQAVQQAPVPPVYGQVPQQTPVAQPQPPAAPAPAQAAPQPPADLTPEQQALLAKLTGG